MLRHVENDGFGYVFDMCSGVSSELCSGMRPDMCWDMCLCMWSHTHISAGDFRLEVATHHLFNACNSLLRGPAVLVLPD